MIRVSIEDGIAAVVLDNPTRKNALNAVVIAELDDALETLRRDESVRAFVLTGSGNEFCAGADVTGMQSDITAVTVRGRMLANHRVIKGLADFNRPVIAAVDGVAYGAGFALALFADFIVASERARFCLAFSRLGLIPDLDVAHTLPRLVDMQRARELIYSAREVSAAEALDLGLVLEVHRRQRSPHVQGSWRRQWPRCPRKALR
jgi:enoyl-CoA hydratase/carnithine racemase